MAPTKRVDTKRVDININSYDQCFALTQKLINDGLETSWLQLIEDENSVLVKPVNISKPGIAKISNSKFTCPLYVMEVGYQEANQGACYMMCFKEGTMTVHWQSEGSTDEDPWFDEVYDMKGWKIAFQLELGLTQLERQHPWFNKLLGQPPPDEKDTLRTRIIAGDYSLNSLVAKFETAIFDLKKSNFNGADILGAREEIKENFIIMINKTKTTFFKHLHDTKTVGYAMQSSAKPEDKPKLNFVPYRIQYQTYPWSNPALEMQTTSGLTGNANLNCLLYLETTDGKELPTERFLPYQGNFTDGRLEATYNSEASEFGAFHMSSRNFFDGYLLKKLQILNHMFEPVITKVEARVTDWKNPYADWIVDFNIGQSPKPWTDPSYKFEKGSNPNSWGFVSSYTPKASPDETGWRGWSGDAKATASCSCKTVVSFEPGTDIITVKGSMFMKMGFKFNNYKLFGSDIKKDNKLEWALRWTLTLDLEAVSDGGLQILSTFDGPHTEIIEDSLSELTKYREYSVKAVQTAVDNSAPLRNALIADLQNQQSLLLPAAGVFFFKNPILSSTGDLICSVAYDNTSASLVLDPKVSTPLSQDAKPRAGMSSTEQKPPPSVPVGQQVSLRN